MSRQGVCGMVWMVFLLTACAFSATFTVVTSDTSGAGSLEWALQQTQIHAGPDTVRFALLKTDRRYNGQAWLIYLKTLLPALTDNGTVIDGFSQPPTDAAQPRIEIHGENIPGSAEGWQIRSADNAVLGLSLGGFPNIAIGLTGSGSHDNLIAGCHIGCAADGKTRLRNRLSGIECLRGSHHNTIGGATTRRRNVISGNGTYGIRIEDSHDNLIIGNYIGVDSGGLSALPNGDVAKQQNCAGIMLSYSAKNNRVGNATPAGRNILSGNQRTGLRIEWTGSDGNIVQGNYLGLGADGKTRAANGEAGIVIGRGSRNNLIGGDSTACANIISGNYSSGVQFARASYKNIFKGNWIGPNAALTGIVANAHNGIYFYGDEEEGYPQENVIGPANIICGNGNDPVNRYWAGISLDYGGTSGNVFIGNYIGQDPAGKLIAGQPTGILVQRGSHNNIFGPGNVVSHSLYDGILVMNPTTLGNRFSQNSIFDNHLYAINNTDGGNGELKPPLLSQANSNQVSGYSLPQSMVEIYSDSQDQAQYYIATVTSDSQGWFSWTGTVNQGRRLNVLAIDENGNTSMLASASATPVELLEFAGQACGHGVASLTWRTASEQNNYGFWLQRRQTGDFQNIAFIAGAGTVANTQTYSVADTVDDTGIYYYRLKQMNLDGSVEFSKEIAVPITLPAVFALEPAYPNPFNSAVRIGFHLRQSGQVSVQICNIRGECIRRLTQEHMNAGRHQIIWDGLDDAGQMTASGTLFITLRSGEAVAGQKCALVR